LIRRAFGIAYAAVVTLAPVRAGAQPPPPGVDAALDAAREARGATLDISVLTFANGAVLWERFGHNALVVSDATSGERLAYNWGVFDFDQPNFLTRFLTGDTRYWLAVYPADLMYADYVAADRSARLQSLDLTNVQKAALAEFVAWQALEENRYYRYDYYLDNCSTRVRDAIDRVLGGVVATSLANVPDAPTTWREQTARVTDGDWPAFAGIHVALGRNADKPLTRWHEGFMPGLLADHLATVQVPLGEGAVRPLVKRDTVLFTATRAPLPDRAPFRGFAALILGAFLGGLVFALGGWRADGSRAALLVLRTIATGWYLMGGLLGTALLLAGTVTKHAPYMGSNGSLFQVHPLLLALACLAPFAAGTSRAARIFAPLALLVAAISLLGFLLQLTVFAQDSGLVVAVTVPMHVALAGVLALGRRPTATTPPRPAAMATAA